MKSGNFNALILVSERIWRDYRDVLKIFPFWRHWLLVVVTTGFLHESLLVSIGFMLTSTNRNIFRITGLCEGTPLVTCGSPHTKVSDAELWCCLWSAPEQTVEVVNRDAGWFETPSCSLWRHCNVHWRNQCWPQHHLSQNTCTVNCWCDYLDGFMIVGGQVLILQIHLMPKLIMIS